ncbi:transposase [Streptomyces sp. NPDC059866]|uniref:transposase n=1 Tax=Streptomyces sp. NPDC059866 TaxID=3346978 RepID=UPI00364BB5E0
MGPKQRTHDAQFREGAVRIVVETGKPIPEVAEELGVNLGTLHSWVSRWRRYGSATSNCPAEAGGRRVAVQGGSMWSWSGSTGRWR